MSANIHGKMRSLCLDGYCKPSEYEVSEILTPQIVSPHQVLVKVHAASINPGEIATAAGTFKAFISTPFPIRLGYDLSGTVIGTGDAVKGFSVGDEVFSCLPWEYRGSISEYVIAPDSYLAHKPKNLTHIEAAALPLVSLTAVHTLERVKGGVAGKTALITSGLGGVGSVACQLAKNVYGAAKVSTTVSTDKVLKVKQTLGEGVIDQGRLLNPYDTDKADSSIVIDYKKTDVLKAIPPRSINFVVDTTGTGLSLLPLLSKSDSTFVTISSMPSGRNAKKSIPGVSLFVVLLLDALNFIARFHAWLYGVKYESVLDKSDGALLAKVASWAEEGKLRPVVGKVIPFEKQALRDACTVIASGKGGFGKIVVKILP